MGTFNLAPTGSATYDTDDDEGAQVCEKKGRQTDSAGGVFHDDHGLYILVGKAMAFEILRKNDS